MKLRVGDRPIASRTIAPFTGARIETLNVWVQVSCETIAPFTGARIETGDEYPACAAAADRPLHGGAD